MAALVKFAFCVCAGVGIVAWCVKLAGRDLDWVGRHLFALIVAAGCVAFATGYAGEKPPVPPGPGPTPGPETTNDVFRVNVGLRHDGTVLPYGAPLREVRP